jgi:hypothetical protein
MIDITQPTMILLKDGQEISRHRSAVEAMEKASKSGPGTYTLVRPDATIEISGDVVEPTPEPEPEPTPEPVEFPATLLNGGAGAYFDLADLSTLYQDRAGTIPVTGIGSPVGFVKDKSGNGNHAVAPTDAARPVFSEYVCPNSGDIKRGLLFDGVDDVLATPKITLGDEATLAVGGYSPSKTGTGSPPAETFAAFWNNPDGHLWWFMGRDSSTPQFCSAGAGFVLTYNRPDDGAPETEPVSLVGRCSISKDVSKATRNGVTAVLEQEMGRGPLGAENLYIGHRKEYAYLSGYVTDVLLADRFLTEQETGELDAFLQAKTGAEMPVEPAPEPEPIPEPEPEPEPTPPPVVEPGTYPRPKMIQGQDVWSDPDAHYGPWQEEVHFPTFEYLGKFGFPDNDMVSDSGKTVNFTRGGFSVGGIDPVSGRQIIWVTTHQNESRGYMAFAIPDVSGGAHAGKANQISPYMNCGGGTGKQWVAFDVFYDNGRVVVTTGNWYDAAKEHQDFLHTTDIDLETWKRSNVRGWCNVPGGFKKCGYIGKTPEHLEDVVGPYYMTGATNMSIITQYSPGSSLSGWDGVIPDAGSTVQGLKTFFEYNLDTQWGEHANGRYTWPNETMTPNKPWTMLAGRLTYKYKGFFYGDHFWQIGSTVGSTWGQWYGHNGRFKGVHSGHPDELGNEANPAVHRYSRAGDVRSAYWGTPLYDNGKGALDAKPRGNAQPSEWGYLESVLPGPKLYEVKGVHFDNESGRLYLLQGGAPEIHVYKVKEAA